jgi:hypothetical protein
MMQQLDNLPTYFFLAQINRSLFHIEISRGLSSEELAFLHNWKPHSRIYNEFTPVLFDIRQMRQGLLHVAQGDCQHLNLFGAKCPINHSKKSSAREKWF